MTGITIRNLDERLERKLLLRAAQHGWSLEEEVQEVIGQAVGQPNEPKDLGQFIHERFSALGGVDLSLPSRLPRGPRRAGNGTQEKA